MRPKPGAIARIKGLLQQRREIQPPRKHDTNTTLSATEFLTFVLLGGRCAEIGPGAIRSITTVVGSEVLAQASGRSMGDDLLGP